MPNHITNLISFGDQPEQVAAFHQMLRDLRQKDGVYGSIDFNKLIPMPKALDIESGTRTTNGLDAYRRFITGDKAGAEAFQKEHPEEWALGKQAYENIQQYGSPTWYEWCNKNWGTKWNAYSCVELGKDDDTLEFFTAWSSVPTILDALSRKYPDQTISYCWADEDIGSNVGAADAGRSAPVGQPVRHPAHSRCRTGHGPEIRFNETSRRPANLTGWRATLYSPQAEPSTGDFWT